MNELSDLLEAVRRFLTRYVVFRGEHQPVALSLFVLHTYVAEAADCTGYVVVTSAEKQSGKSRLLEVLDVLVRNPIQVAHISEAALYRTISEEMPTLLFDELDAVFGKNAGSQNEGLRGILNAGYRRGASVRRCVGEGKKLRVEKFDVYCPKVLAGIGQLPDTLSDRGIHIRLQRRARGEHVDRFRPRLVEPEAADLRNALGEWALGALDGLRQASPELPDALDDRGQDVWEPLLALADMAGAEWPTEARSAAVGLAQGVVEEEPLGILLLGHIREAFGGADRLSTEDLLVALTARDDAPWAEWWGKQVSDGADAVKGPAARLSRLLRPYEVRPTQFKEDGEKLRGYRRDHLEPVWSRYLPPPPEKLVLGTSQVDGTRDVPSTGFLGEGGADGGLVDPEPNRGKPSNHFEGLTKDERLSATRACEECGELTFSKLCGPCRERAA
jgi:hypothetical protein